MPSSQKLQIWLKPNCTWMFIGWSSTNFRFFVQIWYSKWRLLQGIWTFSHRVQCQSMSCGGGHLGFPIGIKNINLVKDIPMIIHLQFGFSQFNIGPYGKMFKCLILRNYKYDQMPSSQKLQIWLKPNCTWMFIGWSSTNFRFVVSERKSFETLFP
jgi:hypothetical protein